MKPALARADAILLSLGFTRKATCWNRRRGSLVDVLDVQASKSGDAVAINVGVLSRSVYEVVWNREPPHHVQEPECTVSTRVGMLMGSRDKWWKLDDPDTANSIASTIESYAVPFFAAIDGAAAMKDWLERGCIENKPYPLPIMNLAVLRAELGERAHACATLERLEQRNTGAWSPRIKALKSRLNCT
jgi:hypothetical protein